MRFASVLALLASPALAQTVPCGGDFGGFVDALATEAVAGGRDPAAVGAFFAGVRQDDAVLRADRSQGHLQRDFIDFSRRLISQDRLDGARARADEFRAIFDRVEADYGVPRGVILAFWAFETDFGAVQGDFNTVNALVTLAHDCRRPALFRPEVLAAIDLFARGDLDPATTTGAWAGEIGQVQMLPADILAAGLDGDGDGHVTLKTSAPDAILSAGHMLSRLGWQSGQPWLQEITVPDDLDWSLTGLDQTLTGPDWAALGVAAREGALADLPASVLLPMGRNGPAFLAYPNFRVFFEWNQSLTYVTTAAYFATRIGGAARYEPGNPDPGLSQDQMIALQEGLAARGHDVGEIDGILGSGTRRAVQAEQVRLGLPADAWPTAALLDALN